MRDGCQKATHALEVAETDAENIRKDLNNKAKALDRLNTENKVKNSFFIFLDYIVHRDNRLDKSFFV